MCDGKIIGFTSLLTDTIMIKRIRDESIKTEIKEKLKIGRLSLDKMPRLLISMSLKMVSNILKMMMKKLKKLIS